MEEEEEEKKNEQEEKIRGTSALVFSSALADPPAAETLHCFMSRIFSSPPRTLNLDTTADLCRMDAHSPAAAQQHKPAEG